MGMIKEFKEFAVQGNMFDLAIGVIIGGAFGKIVDGLVNHLLMPVISAIIGKVNYDDIFVVLKAGATAGPYPTLKAATDAGATVLGVGAFLTIVLNFLFLMLAVFFLIKGINKVRKPAEAAPAGPTDVELLTEIRDLLKK